MVWWGERGGRLGSGGPDRTLNFRRPGDVWCVVTMDVRLVVRVRVSCASHSSRRGPARTHRYAKHGNFWEHLKCAWGVIGFGMDHCVKMVAAIAANGVCRRR